MTNNYDVIIVGGGVVGTAVLMQLSRYNLKTLLIEKEDDVSCGASRANSGIVHAGYDCVPNTQKAYFNVLGNRMFADHCRELDVPYRNTGSLVVCDGDGLDGLQVLLEKGKANGVRCEIIGRDRILEIEPNIGDAIQYALYAPDAGIVSPYKLTIAQADYGVLNGGEIKASEKVVSISHEGGHYTVTTQNGVYTSAVLINSAGAGCMEIEKMLGENLRPISYRVGEYFVLDSTEGKQVSTVIFPLPTKAGKGILVAPTVDGNVIYGPTSTPIENGEDVSVSLSGLDTIKAGVSKTYKAPAFRKVIRVYAGVRTEVGSDFVIEKSSINEGYIKLLGICSPGLTSAPAIAKHVCDMVLGFISATAKSELKSLPKHKKFTAMDKEELDQLIKEDPRWGRLICRCEKVSEAEIVNAIHSPFPATTVDAVKRRVRAGMGRCQGGFCAPRVIEILARELNIPITSVKKGGEGSEIAVEPIKSGIATGEEE
ncbi:MAG: NAD(P)/FAD-dependent oxidoreductase [Clostridia bacterium]|nr:NAD(P)/FAD-dependent oxidoreductase [Clostridia bacterium]